MNAPLQQPINASSKELLLNGVCQYRIDNDRIIMEVEEIANIRGSGNTSGTLALEVWALEQPYSGGHFNGYQVVSQALGTLDGQHLFRGLSYALPMMAPAEGRWHMVMMLREWTAGGWVIRDYINFAYQMRAEYKLVLKLDDVPVASL